MDGSNIYHKIVRNDNSLTINAMQRHLEFKSYAIEEQA